VLTAQGAKREPNIPWFWGFSEELSGYPASHAASPTLNRYWETQTGSPTIDADGLRLQATSAAEQILSGAVPVLGSGQPKASVARVRLRFNTSLPAADLEVAGLTDGTNTVKVRYRNASQKLGLQLNSGTEQLSDATVTAGAWLDLEWRLIGTTTAFTCDWRIDYGSGWVAQTQASVTASFALTNWQAALGWSAASTGDVSVAYAVYSATPGHYPLGDYQVVFLRPDTAATPTVLGTASNFRRFTANGTIDGSYDGPAIMAALDDWPPTVGASADGLAVVTADASGIRIPMETYAAAGFDASIRNLWVVAPIWAAAATAATIGVSGYEGSATTVLYSEADPNADTSSTPPYLAKLWRPTNGWTQAKLDAAEVRFVSNDATPDIGPHAVGMEVLVKVASSELLFGDAGAIPRIEQKYDPDTLGILQLKAYTGDVGLEVEYEVNGVAQTPWSVPANSNPATLTLDAPDIVTVNWLTARPA
jgi:hypothetical protein